MWTRDLPPIDAIAAAARLRSLPGLAFLDSAMRHDALGRLSVVAADPFDRFRVRDGRATLDGRPLPGGPFEALRACLAPYRLPADPAFPFPGGAIGYFAYDLGASLERVAHPARRAGLTDDIALDLYDTVLVIDHAAGSARLVATGFPETAPDARERRAQARLAQFADLLRDVPPPEPAPACGDLAWRSNFDRPAYEAAVERVRDYIRAGDIYQANIAQRFTADLPAGFDPFALYRRLRETNPATFGAYQDFEGLCVASSSPERFVRLDGRHVETRPIKGTAKRLPDPGADREAAEALAASAKDRAENVMIVDLLRNDLSRVCEPGSVAVPVLCGLETYAGVHHLVSVVTGTLRDGLDGLDLLERTFPGGSITGAPKIRAMDIIAEIEGDAREIYCGAIGRIGFDGDLDTSIAIRTVFMDGRTAVLQAGGGVTLLSEPGPEYDETLAKAERVFRAFS
ncbi:aminodeoxychorismate synthase component I [Methylobacterium persicinum]|uniref:aminodeoxychorismate synthase n=1 Tax=Methylobacterium persicinum TaxID=374426 RepID=A0ABU0HMC5_9HYPH|nr:aminodeoxychorismate synthase component I [Methylobacterium persicinum]MDQ0443082.1 para-aminobenzoate synthetase component 1 [Methylobacterium persicinum]GJE39001.1 Aminodeoxychorismate synthase component 1 [Methylobacterium persicinum]